MKGTLILFQWQAEAAHQRAEALAAAGWSVSIEAEDGGRGCKLVRDELPTVIVFDLAHRASHSRISADALHSSKATRNLPMVFVDGSDEAISKTRERVPGALFTTSAELLETLEQFAQMQQV
ncbi:MAG: hypothetical protein HC876_01840 [Chloroflexaceae bacterium]|nr:hypothetical protein [Chloroflexaceae bacterium]